MPKFQRGSKAYAKTGRVYIVEAVEGGMIYCSSSGGDTEFPESALFTEQEWAAQADGRRDAVYARIRNVMQHPATAIKAERDAAEAFLGQADRLIPGLLDYIAFTIGERAAAGSDLEDQLSIVKCRKLFDAVAPEQRVAGVSDVLALPADKLMSAGKLGDHMAQAMLEKGLAPHAAAFEEFCDRPRR